MLARLTLITTAVVVSVASAALQCVDLKPSKVCLGEQTNRQTMPAKVCSSSSSPVDLSSWTWATVASAKNHSCSANPGRVSHEQACQTNLIPCTEGLACPTNPMLCYDVCLNGGVSKSHTFFAAKECWPPNAPSLAGGKAFCEDGVKQGRVAKEGSTDCVGLDYFNKYWELAIKAKKPFQPMACSGRFPIFNKNMLDMNADTRVDFMKSLAKKLNRIWNVTNNANPHKWYRPVNIRMRRTQMMKGVVQVFAEVKEFCMVPTRKGTPDPKLKYNKDVYCDKLSVTPADVFANLTKLLDTKKPDRGLMIGEFRIKKQSQPGWPSKPCYVWQPDEKPDIPGWVWALTAVAAMCCLLSVLILQHRYRNRASYVRLNEKLRSYV